MLNFVLNHNTRQQWLLPMLLTLVAVVLFVLPQSIATSLEYNRDLIGQGQWWRLFSGNLLHTNGWHLLFNLGGLLMLTQLFGRDIKPLHFTLFTLINATCVGILLWFFSPDIEIYVGLSGYLHGLFILGCLIEISNGRRSSYLLLFGVSGKIGWETFNGSSEEMTALINAQVATDAHLFGALAALPLFAIYWLWFKFKSPKSPNVAG